jgi:general secretion pathway protein H
MMEPLVERVRSTIPRGDAGRHLARRGNDWPAAPARAGGFTLIELMVVVALIAIASAVASLALRDPASTRLEHEGARLVALLESARTEARASGLTASWEPRPEQEGAEGFRFVGLPPSSQLPTQWLVPGVTAEVPGARAVLLGPEPLIGAQRIVLHLDDQRLTVATDGLGPFIVVDSETPAAGRS